MKMTLDEYIENKLNMLEYEFHFKLNGSEISRMHELKSEIAVDNFAHSLILKYL